jgi:flavin reductase
MFAGGSEAAKRSRFDTAKWRRRVTGAPVLDGVAIGFDCRIDKIVDVGTHDVFFCIVEDIEAGSDRSNLIYYQRKYHLLAASINHAEAIPERAG